MKKIILILITTISFLTCFAQDTITTKKGEDIQSKVMEINQTEVRYKRFDNLEGPVFVILKSDVSMIRYENGTKDIFKEEDKPATTSKLKSPGSNPFLKGQMDAELHYDGYRPASIGTLITSLLSPIAGLIPAIACSTTTPKDINLNYPKPELMKDPAYYNGYTMQAKKIKKKKVWTNWGIGLVVNVIAAIIISSSN